MKLLYVASGHPLQELDDCLMWDKLGIQWFSTGYFSEFIQPYDIHVNLPHRIIDPKITTLFNKQNGFCKEPGQTIKKNKVFTSSSAKNIWQFSREFLHSFDVIFFNFFAENVQKNLSFLRHRPFILKTYAIHEPGEEIRIKTLRRKGLKVVRNSPKEHLISKRYGGHDAIIRGSVVLDETNVSGWVGNRKEVVTFSSSFSHQDEFAQKRRKYYILIKYGCKGVPFKLYGACNENEPLSLGYLKHSDKIKVLQQSRVSLVTGTPNSNNTYSMVEGWIMGTPTVVYGRKMWNSPTYEADELISNGVDGFTSDDPNEICSIIKSLMKDDKLARNISVEGRKKAISIYGREPLSLQWKDFYKTLGFNLHI